MIAPCHCSVLTAEKYVSSTKFKLQHSALENGIKVSYELSVALNLDVVSVLHKKPQL